MTKLRHTRWFKLSVAAIIGLVLALGAGFGGAWLFHQTTEAGTNTSNSEPTVSTTKLDTAGTAAEAYDVISPAVVTVVNYGTAQDSVFASGDSQVTGEGSGVIYRKSGQQYYIVTNEHVISGATTMEVVLNNGDSLTAKLIGADNVTDLAVIAVTSTKDLTTARFAATDTITTGQSVLAVGSPLGLQFAASATKGVISAVNRQLTLPVGDSGRQIQATVIQTDAAINSGNSGGPLVDLAGRIVGINSMKLSGDSASGAMIEGMSFAIPSGTVTTITKQLEATGKVARPTLNASLVYLSRIAPSQRQSVLKLPPSVTHGVVVLSTTSTNLKARDVIIALNGNTITQVGEFYTNLYAFKPGTTVEFTVYRDGKRITIKETLGST